VLLFLLIQVACVGVLGGIGATGLWLRRGWLVPGAFLMLDAGAAILYRTMLEATTDKAMERREGIISQVVR
jgi:hypothetical protein